MDEHISKPIEADSFLRWVGEMVGRAHAKADSNQDVRIADAAPDIDETPLDGLAALMSAERFHAMLDMYLTAARERLSRMEVMAEQQDLTGLGGEAHDLKSTSGSFGARRLQGLAEQLETACRTGDARAVAALMPQIRTARRLPAAESRLAS